MSNQEASHGAHTAVYDVACREWSDPPALPETWQVWPVNDEYASIRRPLGELVMRTDTLENLEDKR